MTTSTREALEQGMRRRSRLRTGLLVGGIVALALGIVAGAGAILVPPWLATVPGEAFTASTTVTLTTAGATSAAGASTQAVGDSSTAGSGSLASEPAHAEAAAAVEVSAGWTPIGIGPFLPADRVELVSPDGAYRARLELSDTAGAGDDDTTPGGSTEHLDEALATASWSRESLDSGCTVRYTTVADGADAVTVAVVSPPSDGPADPDARLVLVGTVAAADADAYRTVTADLVTSARFDRPGEDVLTVEDPP